MKMLPAAIFDMDGLMFDTERMWVEAHEHVAARYGYAMDPKFLMESMGVNGAKMAAIVARYFPKARADEFWDEALEYVLEETKKEVPVKEGLLEILELFRRNGVKMAVASGSPVEAVLSNVRRTGTEKYFSAFVSSDTEVPPIPSKPLPDIFLRAAQKLGVAPGECYVFEDSFNGIRAAAAAGACPVMIPDRLPPDDEMREKASAIFESLSEAAKAIERGEL